MSRLCTNTAVRGTLAGGCVCMEPCLLQIPAKTQQPTPFDGTVSVSRKLIFTADLTLGDHSGRKSEPANQRCIEPSKDVVRTDGPER